MHASRGIGLTAVVARMRATALLLRLEQIPPSIVEALRTVAARTTGDPSLQVRTGRGEGIPFAYTTLHHSDTLHIRYYHVDALHIKHYIIGHFA